VVDDGSTEGSAADIVAQMADARIRIIKHTARRWMGAARNTGFEAARFPLLLPLDADDMLKPCFLSRLVEMMDGDPSLDCAVADFELFGVRTGVRQFTVEPLEAMADWEWLPGAGVLMKRELWSRAGKFSELECFRVGNEDWDFWMSAAEVGFKAGHCGEPLYMYRQHESSTTLRLVGADYVTRRDLYRRHRDFIQRQGKTRGFLAEGYWRSGDYARNHGQAFKSLYLGLRGMILDGNWRRYVRLAKNNAAVARKNAGVRLFEGDGGGAGSKEIAGASKRGEG